MTTYQQLLADAQKKWLSEADVKSKAQSLWININDWWTMSWQTPESKESAMKQVYWTSNITPTAMEKPTQDAVGVYNPKTERYQYVNKWETINAKWEVIGNPKTKYNVDLTSPEAINASWLDDAFTIDEEWNTRVNAWKIASWMKWIYWPLTSDIKKIAQEMGDSKWLFESRIKTAMMKADENKAIADFSIKKMQDAFGLLEWAQAQKYQDMLDRIDKQESLVDTKFNEMRKNLDVIKSSYQTQQEAWEQAASVAASRQLRWVGGGAGQAIASWLWQARARTSMLNMAKLDAELAEQANTLEQNYLQMKNTVMQDKNLTDTQRSEILWALNDKFNVIQGMQTGAEQQYVAEKYAPIEQTQQAITQTQLSQYANDANQSWLNKSPQMREAQIQQILWTALSSGVKLPADVVSNARNASTATEMMNYLYNYIISNVPKSSVNSSSLAAIKALLWASSNQSTTTSKVEA